jgi:hypothetical protein
MQYNFFPKKDSLQLKNTIMACDSLYRIIKSNSTIFKLTFVRGFLNGEVVTHLCSLLGPQA